MLESRWDLKCGKVKLVRLFFRSILAFCALAFLVSSVGLSIAPAHPYLKGRSPSSHFSRINKTSEAGVEGAGEIALEDRPPRFLEFRSETASLPELEIPFPKVPQLLRFYNFRSPPVL
jgi:hypothetical protein